MPPTKKTTPKKTASASVWASTAPLIAGDEEELTLPSGQTCRARKIGMEGLLQAGLIGEADTLSSLVDQKHVRKVRGAKGKADGETLDAESLVKDSKGMAALMGMTDKALPMIVVSPVVRLNLDENGDVIPLAKREKGVIYTDQIGMLDKFELFAWAVGDMAHLNTFRGGKAAGDVAAVGDGKSVPRATKRAPRAR